MNDMTFNIDERISFVDCDMDDDIGDICVIKDGVEYHFTWDSKPRKSYHALSEAVNFLSEK